MVSSSYFHIKCFRIIKLVFSKEIKVFEKEGKNNKPSPPAKKSEKTIHPNQLKLAAAFFHNKEHINASIFHSVKYKEITSNSMFHIVFPSRSSTQYFVLYQGSFKKEKEKELMNPLPWRKNPRKQYTQTTKACSCYFQNKKTQMQAFIIIFH